MNDPPKLSDFKINAPGVYSRKYGMYEYNLYIGDVKVSSEGRCLELLLTVDMYDICFKLSLSHLAASHRSLRRFQQVRQHGSPATCVRCQSAQDDE